MTNEITELAAEFNSAGPRAASAIFTAYKVGGEAFAEAWKSNATATSGEHGVHYPSSITSEVKFAGMGIEIETGPDSSMKQGRMGRGFEFGSQNQPPHLDGLTAMGPAADAIYAAADEAIEQALP